MTPTVESSMATSSSVHAVEAARHRSKKRRVDNQEDEATAAQSCHRPGIYIAAVPAH